MSYLFSIIIPTYNSGATIRRCLESLAVQTFTDFEVLVMDGVSTDDTLRITEELAGAFQGRIRITSEPDKGVYDAMNKGILGARGKWLLFLGSDDRLNDDLVLEKASASLRTSREDIVYGSVIFQHCRVNYGGPFSLGKILLEGNICHQAIFYNKTVFEKIGVYDLAYKIYADYDYNVRCFSSKLIRHKYIDLIISEYNERDGLTGKNTPDKPFHMKREDYRSEYRKTMDYRLYQMNKVRVDLLNRIKFRLKKTFS
jgi:glycosyltransferase involved in cell wall biosynthesis